MNLQGAVTQTPVSAAVGQKVKVSVAVTNAGNVTASGPLAVALSLSDSASGSKAVLAATVTKPIKLKPGGRKVLSLTFVLPVGTKTGSRFVVAKVDPTNHFGDATQADNIAVGTAAVNVV